MRYTLNIKDGKSTLTVFTTEGNIVTVDGEHPNFADAWEAVRKDDEQGFMAQADVITGIKQAFESVTSRVTVDGHNLYLDGEKIDGRLADTIIDFRRKGENYLPLVNFIERLGNNPSMRSRDQLYTWLAERNFTITPSGKFIAYKGVSKCGDKFQSHFSGRASVNGVEQNGQIVQGIGDVVTMPRPKVNDNADIGCSQGLHAGTWEYASTFGNGYTLTVEIDPANVVSVPSDCSFQKLRVCEYRITGAAEIPYSERVVADYDDDEDEGDEYECLHSSNMYGTCDYCGCDL